MDAAKSAANFGERIMTEVVLRTQIENRDGIQLIQVSGPLDSTTLKQFRNLLDPLVNQPRVRIVLDCEKLTYLNGNGLALLSRYQRVALHNLSVFGVAALPAQITKALELLRMAKRVKFYPTVAEALQAAAAL